MGAAFFGIGVSVIFLRSMILDIFDSTRHWSYSADDELAENDFSLL